ncbi:MAG: VWA domain-containing protein [Pirellulaceae bacterium]|nr:VWA domain-containing protein [Pirellulaceae bacterium]
MLVLIAIMLVAFMATVAFTVDIAFMHLTRTELRTSTDAAAKAAALELSRTFDQDQAIARGQQIAAQNFVAGDPLLLEPNDFQFGRSEETPTGRFEFSADSFPTNSVRINGRRTAGSASGAVPLFFGNVMGVEFFEPTADASATYIERDVVLVVDRSGSMSGQKIADLISAIDIFVQTLDETPVDERVGLASYNDTATEDVQLTEDLELITTTMADLPVGGFTSISRGMEAGRKIMNKSRDADFVERTLIVMTDGRHNRGPEPRDEAIKLAADGVQIHTITFGADADVDRMAEVALIGGGNHFHALSGDELRDIYREIALTLSTVMTE